MYKEIKPRSLIPSHQVLGCGIESQDLNKTEQSNIKKAPGKRRGEWTGFAVGGF